MPISQILPDGRIRVYNTKTGQTKDVRPEELAAISPKLVGQYQQLQANVQGVSSGQLSPVDLPQDQRSLTATGLEAGGYDPARKEAEVAKVKEYEKKRTLLAPTEQLVSTLEDYFQKSGGGKYEGPLARVIGKGKSVSSAAGLNANVKTYEDTKKGFIATLRGLTGDVGVLTEEDARRIAGLMPEIGATPDEARNAFNVIRAQIAAKYGGQGQQTSINPGEGYGIQDFVKGQVKNLKNFATDVGVGAAAPGITQDINQQTDQGYQLLAQAKNEQDPKRKKALEDQARAIFAGGSQQAEQLAGQFSEDVNRNPYTRGLTVGADIAGFAGLANLIPGLAKGSVNLLRKPPIPTPGNLSKVLPKTFSKTALGKARDESYKLYPDVKVSGKNISDVADDFISRNPEFEKVGREVMGGLDKRTFTPKSLVEQISDWSKTIYDKSGGVKSSKLAEFRSILAKAGREQLRQEAPETAKVSELFAKLYGREALFKKAVGGTLGLSFLGGLGYLGASKIAGGNQ